MTKESRAFLIELHRLIENDVKNAMSAITDIDTTERNGLLKLGDDKIALLRSIELDPDQLEALRLALVELSQGTIFGILSLIDGVAFAESEDLPNLALVDLDTGKEISDQFLHDEFYEVIQ